MSTDPGPQDERVERRLAGESIGRYHEEQLRRLLEHVRDGLAQLDAGEIDAFELDELIHRYKRSAHMLWTFCGQSEQDRLRASRRLRSMRERDQDLPDWWAEGEPRRRG
jgi:hypothetical protein